MTSPTHRDVAALDRQIRAAYEEGQTYNPKTICAVFDAHSQDHAATVLRQKLQMVERHYSGGLAVDLCCATGKHLFHMAPELERGIGVDFSNLFLNEAKCLQVEAGFKNLDFVCGSARQLPIATGVVDLLYSLSSLYVIPHIEDIFAEISRVLRPGGRCVLDMGNIRSLNTICCRSYAELPPTFFITIGEMKNRFRQNNLRIVEHRAFQILPLWADRPHWLWPLLHPNWNVLLQRRVRGRMLDEWLSNLPILKSFAFRHLFVCEKIN